MQSLCQRVHGVRFLVHYTSIHFPKGIQEAHAKRKGNETSRTYMREDGVARGQNAPETENERGCSITIPWWYQYWWQSSSSRERQWGCVCESCTQSVIKAWSGRKSFKCSNSLSPLKVLLCLEYKESNRAVGHQQDSHNHQRLLLHSSSLYTALLW